MGLIRGLGRGITNKVIYYCKPGNAEIVFFFSLKRTSKIVKAFGSMKRVQKSYLENKSLDNYYLSAY